MCGGVGVLPVLDAAVRGEHVDCHGLPECAEERDVAHQGAGVSSRLPVVVRAPHYLLLHEPPLQAELRGNVHVLWAQEENTDVGRDVKYKIFQTNSAATDKFNNVKIFFLKENVNA